MKTFPTLYKRDSKGKLREWRAEVDGAHYRTVSGLADGKQVTSEWKETFAKNAGRSNATTAEEQAVAEVEAIYTKRLDGEYHENSADIDQARFFKPMLADTWDKRKDKIEYPVYMQPKLDGIRCIANKDGLWSRTGKRIVACPHIEQELAETFAERPDLVLDGELYNHEYKDDFNKISSMVRKTKPSAEDLIESENKVQYHVYDVPSYNERFELRRIGFTTIADMLGNKVVCVETPSASSEEEVDKYYDEYLERGYEGGIVRTEGLYEQKRSKHLLKRKDFEDKEFEIVRIEEGQGNWAGYAKRVIFLLEDGRECGAGLAGNQEFTREVLARSDEYIGRQVTVQFSPRTPDGVPRFPIAKALHLSKRW